MSITGVIGFQVLQLLLAGSLRIISISREQYRRLATIIPIRHNQQDYRIYSQRNRKFDRCEYSMNGNGQANPVSQTSQSAYLDFINRSYLEAVQEINAIRDAVQEEARRRNSGELG
jgi:hypothetical protein